MNLVETLQEHKGQHVVVRFMKRDQVMALNGIVEARGEHVVLRQERQHIDEMIMTPQGAKKVDEIIPEAIHYIGHITSDDLITITVNLETQEEAKKQLKAGESMIHKPGKGMLPGMGGPPMP